MTRRINTLPIHLSLAMTNWLSLTSDSTSRKPISKPASGVLNSSKNSLKSLANQPLQQRDPQRKKPLPPSVLDANRLLKLLQNLSQPLPVSPAQNRQQVKSPRKNPLSAPSKKPSNEKHPNPYAPFLEQLDAELLGQAITQENHRRTLQTLEGIAQYYEQHWQEREAISTPYIWKKGSARLFDYGGEDNSPTLLLIPSLINKSYIFDLYSERSVVKHLQAQGVRVTVLDWGEPAIREQQFNCGDYVYYYAIEALRTLRRHHQGPIVLAGYCMGGIFATAMAQLAPEMIDALILLATPWDFHADDVTWLALDDAMREQCAQLIMQQNTVPPEWTETIFHMINPWHFQQKFQRFPTMSDIEKQHFIAVESWVNDGVPLSRHVAKECFIDWPQDNTLQQGKWQVGGRAITPETIEVPTLVIAPQEDRIVPAGSALTLAEAIPHTDVIQPPSGHVSMLVGNQAQKTCLDPMLEWIAALHL